MKPITFACRADLPLPPDKIADQILDLANWPDFRGYGILPGIAAAEFEHRSSEVVGTRIGVVADDGSRHVEEILLWQPDQCVEIRMHRFSPPLNRLATEFLERWEFASDGKVTHVVRRFEMHSRSIWTRPLLWIISRLMRRAVARHLRQLATKHDGSTS